MTQSARSPLGIRNSADLRHAQITLLLAYHLVARADPSPSPQLAARLKHSAKENHRCQHDLYLALYYRMLMAALGCKICGPLEVDRIPASAARQK